VSLTPAQLEWAWLAAVDLEVNDAFDPADAGRWMYTIDSESQVGAFAESEDGGMATTLGVTVHINWNFVEPDEASEPDVTAEPDESTQPEDGVQLEPPFTLDLRVNGYFTWEPHMRPEDRIARLWLDYNGRYLLWPYVRNYIAMVTGMTNLPALTIVTERVPDPPALDVESGTSDVSGAESEVEPTVAE
jgi:hypothetical protein